MRANGGGTTFQPSYLPTKETEAAYGRAMGGFLLSLVTSVMGILVLPDASFLAIVLAIVAFGLFVYALKHSAAAGRPSPQLA